MSLVVGKLTFSLGAGIRVQPLRRERILDPKLPGQLPEQLPGQLPGQLSGQVPGHLSGQVPGQLSGQVPGQLSGQLQRTVLRKVPECRQQQNSSDSEHSELEQWQLRTKLQKELLSSPVSQAS
jgi:hypothetical protein